MIGQGRINNRGKEMSRVGDGERQTDRDGKGVSGDGRTWEKEDK